MKKPTKKPEQAKTEKPFPLPVNEARGEAGLWIDDIPLVLAATMQGLANVSSRLQCKSLNELFLRLSQVEIAAAMAGIELLTVRGNWSTALEKLQLRHFAYCGVVFGQILAHHFDGDQGNVGAADEAA